MGGRNSVNNRCRIAKHFRPNYFIGTYSHCVFSNTIQNELAANLVTSSFSEFLSPATTVDRFLLSGIDARNDHRA